MAAAPRFVLDTPLSLRTDLIRRVHCTVCQHYGWNAEQRPALAVCATPWVKGERSHYVEPHHPSCPTLKKRQHHVFQVVR